MCGKTTVRSILQRALVLLPTIMAQEGGRLSNLDINVLNS